MCYYLCSEALNTSEEPEDCAFYRLFFVVGILLFVSALNNGMQYIIEMSDKLQ